MSAPALGHGGQAATRRRRVGAALLAAALLATAALWLRPMTTAPAPTGADGSSAGVSPTPAALPAARGAQLEPRHTRAAREGRHLVLRAYGDFEAGRYAEAAAGFEQAIAAAPALAQDPGLLCDYADALGMAQGGSLEGEPTRWIERALALQPRHPKALEMAGSAAYGRRDFAAAVRHWQALRTQLDEGSPPQRALDAAIERARRLAATSLPRG